MDANNYQWGYQSIYEEDAISVATAQLAAWRERLEMNGVCSTYGAANSTERCSFINEDVQYMGQYNYPPQNDPYSNTCNYDWWDQSNLSWSDQQFLQQNTWSTDPPDFSQPMQLSENKLSLEDLMRCRQPESFPSNTEPNPRQNDITQCPSVMLRIEVQQEPELQNADELVSCSSSPNSSSKPTPPSPFKQCIPPPPFKQASFNEEKASQVKFLTFPPIIKHVPLELNSSYQMIIIATTGVERISEKVRLPGTINGYIINNLTGECPSHWMSGNFYCRAASLPLLKLFDPGGHRTHGAPQSGAPSSPQAAGEHPPPSSSDRLIRPDQIDGDEATSADRHKLIEELADPTSAGFISSSLHSSSSSVPIPARTEHVDGQQSRVGQRSKQISHPPITAPSAAPTQNQQILPIIVRPKQQLWAITTQIQHPSCPRPTIQRAPSCPNRRPAPFESNIGPASNQRGWTGSSIRRSDPTAASSSESMALPHRKQRSGQMHRAPFA
ncbi:hypothetical protein ACLOJK_008028, partial [Asimina triloba]